MDPNPELNFHRPNAPGRGRFGDNHVSTGTTALFRAVQLNDAASVEALLKAGADPNIVTMGFNAFLMASGAGPTSRGNRAPGNLEIVKLLFDDAGEGKTPDVNAQVTGLKNYSYNVSYVSTDLSDEGTSALHAAAEDGNLELVKYLLEKGADPNLVDSEGKKPIDLIPSLTLADGRGKGKGKGKGAPKGGFGRGRGPVAPPPDPADLAEIRSLLEAAQ